MQISDGGGTSHLLEQVDDHHQMTQEGTRFFVRECSPDRRVSGDVVRGVWHWLQKESGRRVTGQEVVQDVQSLTQL